MFAVNAALLGPGALKYFMSQIKFQDGASDQDRAA